MQRSWKDDEAMKSLRADQRWRDLSNAIAAAECHLDAEVADEGGYRAVVLHYVERPDPERVCGVDLGECWGDTPVEAIVDTVRAAQAAPGKFAAQLKCEAVDRALAALGAQPPEPAEKYEEELGL